MKIYSKQQYTANLLMWLNRQRCYLYIVFEEKFSIKVRTKTLKSGFGNELSPKVPNKEAPVVKATGRCFLVFPQEKDCTYYYSKEEKCYSNFRGEIELVEDPIHRLERIRYKLYPSKSGLRKKTLTPLLGMNYRKVLEPNQEVNQDLILGSQPAFKEGQRSKLMLDPFDKIVHKTWYWI